MNPWLEIPLDEYEAHMALASVGQAQFLARVLGELVQTLRPASVAVLGCSGGNGFEQLSPQTVRRVVGVDINPRYIEAARRRFEGRFDRLELFCKDLLDPGCLFSPVDFVYAGLLFEYIDPSSGLRSIQRILKPGGHLCVVLQLPSDTVSAISPSPYGSLGKLQGILRMVPPEEIVHCATAAGFEIVESKQVTLDSGKSLHQLLLRQSGRLNESDAGKQF